MMPRPSVAVRIRSAELERALAEEVLAALLLEDQQRALHGADGGGRDVAVGRRNLVGSLCDLDEERAQVLEIEQQQAFVVGELEGDVEHALLRVVEIEEARQQQRPHLRDGRPHRMALACRRDPRRSSGTRRSRSR